MSGVFNSFKEHQAGLNDLPESTKCAVERPGSYILWQERAQYWFVITTDVLTERLRQHSLRAFIKGALMLTRRLHIEGSFTVPASSSMKICLTAMKM